MTDDTVIIKRHAEKPRAEPAQSFPVVLETGLRQIGKPALPQNARKTGKASYVTFNDPAETIAVKADIKTFFSPHRHSAAYGAIRARDG